MRQDLSCSLSLGSNDGNHLVTLAVGTALGAESLAGQLDSELLLLLDAGSDHFAHLLLIRGEASNLVHDSTNGGNSGVQSALAVGSVVLLGIRGTLHLGNNETVVKTNENSTLLQLLHHLVSLK